MACSAALPAAACVASAIATVAHHEYLVSTMVDLQEDEIIEVCVGGGAGFGPPSARSPADAARDGAEGYIL